MIWIPRPRKPRQRIRFTLLIQVLPKSDSKVEKESKGEGKPRPCPRCGRYLNESHTTKTCSRILNKREGYNPNWKDNPWKDSDAGKAQLKDHKIWDSYPSLELWKRRKSSGLRVRLV